MSALQATISNSTIYGLKAGRIPPAERDSRPAVRLSPYINILVTLTGDPLAACARMWLRTPKLFLQKPAG